MLANRFVHAIKEKYPDSLITTYFDTDNNYMQSNLLKKIWPSIYQNSIVIPNRKSKEHKVKSQFGEELYNADLNNQCDEYLTIFKNADKFYNLCIDNMDWVSADFDWVKYFRFFPKPEIVPDFSKKFALPDKFILGNFYSRPNSPYLLEQWYVERLLKEISIVLPIVIITLPEYRSYYDFCANNPRIKIVETTLEETFYLASKCEAFIGIDSGIRCMSYYFDKPTFFFTTYCTEYGQVPLSHLLRWAIYELSVLPMHYPTNKVVGLLSNAISHKVCQLYPHLDPKHIDNSIIKRNIYV